MIPKIIHQIWLGPKSPPWNLMNTWRQNHPDWAYYLWRDSNRPILTAEKQFNRITSYTMKSDILRYELMFKYGGMYVDCDVLCLKPFDHLLEYQKDLVLCQDEGVVQIQGMAVERLACC